MKFHRVTLSMYSLWRGVALEHNTTQNLSLEHNNPSWVSYPDNFTWNLHSGRIVLNYSISSLSPIPTIKSYQTLACIAITFMSNFIHATKRLESKIRCFRIIKMATCFCDQTIHTTAHTNNIPNCTMHSTDQLSLEDFNTGSIIYMKCFNSNFFTPVFPATCSVSYSFVSNPKPSIMHGLIGKFKTRETF